MRTAEEILNENDEVYLISEAYIACMKQYAKEAIEECAKRTYYADDRDSILDLINELK